MTHDNSGNNDARCLFFPFNSSVCIPEFKANELYFFLQVVNKIDLPGAEPEQVIREIEEVRDSLHCVARFMMFLGNSNHTMQPVII